MCEKTVTLKLQGVVTVAALGKALQSFTTLGRLDRLPRLRCDARRKQLLIRAHPAHCAAAGSRRARR